MPYVIPPATGAVGAHRSGNGGDRTGVHAELGLSPFQLSPTRVQRPFDATVSATFDHAQRTAWGAAIAAGPVLHPWGVEQNQSRRLTPQLVGRWDTEGRGAALRVTLERGTFLTGPTSSSNAAGAAWGESAIGFYVEAGMRWPEMREQTWAVGAGITLRVPAMAGIACCIH